MARRLDLETDGQVAVIADADVPAFLRRVVRRRLLLEREERAGERDLPRERSGVPPPLGRLLVEGEQSDV